MSGAMNGVRIESPGTLDELAVTALDRPVRGDGDVLVEVRAAAVNPSDVMNVSGMPITTYPRVPGRDFAGVVVEGPDALVGSAVWGTGSGDLGFSRDGSHAELLAVPEAAVLPVPDGFSMVDAGASGLAYLTAWAGLSRTRLEAGKRVLVTGAAGGVGSAVGAIALWRGAEVVAAVKDDGERAIAQRLLPGAQVVTTERGLSETGIDIAFDTVGGQLFDDILASFADDGQMVVISGRPGTAVGFDLFAFYRRRLSVIGAGSTGADAPWCASLLRELLPGFSEGALPPVHVAETLPAARAAEAYRLVASGQAGGRVVLTFG